MNFTYALSALLAATLLVSVADARYYDVNSPRLSIFEMKAKLKQDAFELQNLRKQLRGCHPTHLPQLRSQIKTAKKLVEQDKQTLHNLITISKGY